MNITQVGIDWAKLNFQVHGVEARGNPLLRKQLKRSQVATFFAWGATIILSGSATIMMAGGEESEAA